MINTDKNIEKLVQLRLGDSLLVNANNDDEPVAQKAKPVGNQDQVST